MANTLRHILLGLTIWLGSHTFVFAQLRPLSPTLQATASVVEQLEQKNFIVLRCESDYLFRTDSLRKSISAVFTEGDAYKLQLMGNVGDANKYAISVYNVDKKGTRTTNIFRSPSMTEHILVDFRPEKTAVYELEISAVLDNPTHFYAQYGFVIARDKGDAIDNDERVLSLVQRGILSAQLFEKEHTEPVHVEINTIIQGDNQGVEVIRNFNRGRDYVALALSNTDIPELQLSVYRNKNNQWQKVATGNSAPVSDPELGDMVVATISPDSMAKYAVFASGKRFKKGEMAGRCLILIATSVKPVEPDTEPSSVFRSRSCFEQKCVLSLQRRVPDYVCPLPPGHPPAGPESTASSRQNAYRYQSKPRRR